MLTRYLVEGYTADGDADFVFSGTCKSILKAKKLALQCQQRDFEWLVMFQVVQSSDCDLWDTIYRWGSFSVALSDIGNTDLAVQYPKYTAIYN